MQQSRIQAEIQKAWMRTRLVPFSRLLPRRLQRIVRQTISTPETVQLNWWSTIPKVNWIVVF